jgi:hypothetical protein
MRDALERIAAEQKVYKGHGDYEIVPALTAEEAQSVAREALSLLTTKASDDELVEALDAAEGLCNFAYRQGYHEPGYDPIKVIRAAISSMPTIADEGEQ